MDIFFLLFLVGFKRRVCDKQDLIAYPTAILFFLPKRNNNFCLGSPSSLNIPLMLQARYRAQFKNH